MAAPNGMAMLLKAMGLDPQVLAQKGAELEQAAKTLGAEIQSKIASVDARMTHIENMLAYLIHQNAQQQGRVTPAGETTLEVESLTKEVQVNGRYT